jgi:hypothetical protein
MYQWSQESYHVNEDTCSTYTFLTVFAYSVNEDSYTFLTARAYSVRKDTYTFLTVRE